MITLVVARHGNTFNPGETPRRVGARTDLPLTASGREQGVKVGRYLRRNGLIPQIAFTSPLKRTRETCELALLECKTKSDIVASEFLREIDYGPDENKTEEEVIARIGRKAIDDWNESAIVPPGWRVDPDELIEGWREFAASIAADITRETAFAVTSNGIARFLPYILEKEDFDNFTACYKLKVSTGALCIFCHDGLKWRLRDWNLMP